MGHKKKWLIDFLYDIENQETPIREVLYLLLAVIVTFPIIMLLALVHDYEKLSNTEIGIHLVVTLIVWMTNVGLFSAVKCNDDKREDNAIRKKGKRTEAKIVQVVVFDSQELYVTRLLLDYYDEYKGCECAADIELSKGVPYGVDKYSLARVEPSTRYYDPIGEMKIGIYYDSAGNIVANE